MLPTPWGVALKRLVSIAGEWRPGFRRRPLSRPPEPQFSEFFSYAEFQSYQDRTRAERSARVRIEEAAIQDDKEYTLPGYCDPCERTVDLLVDYRYARTDGDRLIPNWRERLVCPCGLNSRVRASLHTFRRYCKPRPSDPIYMTEQVTPLFRWLSQRYSNLTGSEYLGRAIPLGSTRADGVRNESVTGLSFAAGSFRHLLSFDVFEHVPDYPAALAECARVLRPGGYLLFTVPFLSHAEQTLVRARVGPDGNIDHLEEPEYHGDPMVADGCLCFYHFGWDLLAVCRAAGFASAKVIAVWSPEFGYLGGNRLLFLATK